MRTVRPRLLETLAAPALGGAGRLLPFVALFRTLCLPFSNPSTAWEYGFLVDYDLELLETHLHAGPDPFPRLCETYVEARPGDLDMRSRYAKDPAFAAESYFQVFSDRMPFAPNLSFADLLFAEGPASVSVF